MAQKSIPVTTQNSIDQAEDCVSQAIAILEMAWRTDHVNEDDFEMLQLAARATRNILKTARGLLASETTEARNG